jgi:hypothetical protein
MGFPFLFVLGVNLHALFWAARRLTFVALTWMSARCCDGAHIPREIAHFFAAIGWARRGAMLDRALEIAARKRCYRAPRRWLTVK